MNMQAIIEGDTAPDEEAARDWFSLAELAELALPGLPADKRALSRRVRHERWDMKADASGALLARPRMARGGGTEYHVSILPGAVQLELAMRGLSQSRPAPSEAESLSAGAWRWFDQQSDKIKAEAVRRVGIIADIDVLVAAGMSRSAAVTETARSRCVSASTLWIWVKLADGVARSDRLPALAPRFRGGGIEADIDASLWSILKSDFLRPEEPTLASCYERTAEIAAERGLSLPSLKTISRKLVREVDPRIVLRMRKGKEALRRSIPAQRRSVAELHALECVNIDGHTFDVRVIDRAGNIIRPILVGIQDIRSSKILAWRVCEAESAHYVQLVFGDLFANFGIPVHCVLDNGRGFASKWITGGVKNRFRFKVKDSDPLGLIVELGIQHHWALPYHGQSKPIERAWLDLTDRIARHPFVAGAYTGRSPAHKPENYGSRAIPWDEFCGHVSRQIIKHNARLGRRGRDYRGRSFDDVFNESYASAPITKATPDQLRRALLVGEQKTVNRQTGEIELFGTRYYSEGCSRLHGQRVTVRFDPDDLTREIHVYDLAGHYLTAAQPWADVKFLTADSAKQSAKFYAEQRKKVRAGVEAEELLKAADVAAYQVDTAVPELPAPGAVRLVQHRGQTAAALKVMPAPAPVARESENRVFASLEKMNLRIVD